MRDRRDPFVKQLTAAYKNKIINKQQFKTIRGQYYKGDIIGSQKGYLKLLNRKCKDFKEWKESGNNGEERVVQRMA